MDMRVCHFENSLRSPSSRAGTKLRDNVRSEKRLLPNRVSIKTLPANQVSKASGGRTSCHLMEKEGAFGSSIFSLNGRGAFERDANPSGSIGLLSGTSEAGNTSGA